MILRPVYLDGWSNLSAQATFDATTAEPVTSQNGFLIPQEPLYKALLPRRPLRRWSRLVRMGLATALQALERAGQPPIDAILSGTAWGEVQDTERFLEALVVNEEQYLTPTAFVQSTHNTVAGQLALQQQNQGYNMTYVQGVVSFELALLDAWGLLQDDAYRHVLVSSADVLTERVQRLLRRLDCATAARSMGEGAACFVLSRVASAQSIARLVGGQTRYRSTPAQQRGAVAALLDAVDYTGPAVELVLTPTEPTAGSRALFPHAQWLPYESLCGHYPTQPAFGLGLLAGALDGDEVAQRLLGLHAPLPQRMALYQESGAHWSVVLLDRFGLSL